MLSYSQTLPFLTPGPTNTCVEWMLFCSLKSKTSLNRQRFWDNQFSRGCTGKTASDLSPQDRISGNAKK